MRNWFSRIAFLVIFLSGVMLLRAQDVASITGVVQDTTGAVIPGVSVVLSHPATGAAYKTTTNASGAYRFSDVPPGPGYKITFTHSGFSAYTVESIYLNVANVRTQDVKMIAGSSQQVEVSATSQTVTIDTEDATIGNNYQVSKLNDLPVYNRNTPAALFTLQPGVTSTGSTTGARTDQDDVTVDGLDVNDFATGNAFAIVGNAPVDSVQEFKGTVGGFTSNSGPGGGGQFQLVTRSGTNHFHGNVNEYHRDRSTVANDWFNNNLGLPRTQLIQNQFGGSLGGPIIHNKAFFFFDYLNSRIAQSVPVERTVPLPSYVAGNVSYINNNTGCTKSSRQNTTPSCISALTPAQVKAMDPAGIGEDQALFAFITKAYPAANDLTYGDGVNTGGFRFNAPEPDDQTDYVGKIDYTINSRMKIFGVGSFIRHDAVETAQEFPSDPVLTAPFSDRSYRWAVGHNWQIGNNKVNQATYGETVANYLFPVNFNPQGLYPVSFATGTTTLLSNPYKSPVNAQGREVPIPQVTDDFNWQLGHHAIDIGGVFKWIHTHDFTKLDYSTLGLGLGGETQSLTAALRPINILTPSSTAQVTYDSAFAAALGRIASITGNFNYDNQGNPLPQGTGDQREYKYYQTELYVGDSWKVTPHLTLTYGINYQIFSVPYEVHGLETVQNTSFDSYFSARIKQSAAGLTGNTAVPFISYVLGGKANNGPPLYNPDHKDFAPRVAFAYSPGFSPKTVFNGSAAIVYDRTIINAVQYQQDQYSYLFQQPLEENFGDSTSPSNSLKNDPRYGTNPASLITPPATPKPPFTPYVDAGVPYGLQNGGAFNESVDPNLRTPYSILVNFGMQHEFPGSFIFKASYVGRFGRRLLAQADANQIIDFADPVSGELLSTAFSHMTVEERNGADTANLPAEPWMENLVIPGLGQAYGYPNNTSLVGDVFSSLVSKGDFADTVQGISGITPPNVGMGAQFSENTFYTNKGFSTYDGLLTSLQKNLSHGLQFDVNYTFSHSIDNVSVVANAPAIGGYGFICDVQHPRSCRGNSDFDVTHVITGDFTYSLPFGRGRAFGSNIPWGLNEVIGGWDISGITTWHSGVAYSTVASAFVAGYANDAPAIFNGDRGALRHSIHKTSGNQLFMFADPTAAVNTFQGPIGFTIGSRNNLRGPQYFDQDMGLAKSFPILPAEGLVLKFRADAFNAFNHPNFASPGTETNYDDITQPGSFGQLTSMNGDPRVLQLALRLEF